MELKDRLKKARKDRKISQVKLSEMTGLDQTTISNLETGKVLSTSKIVQVAHALGVNPRWLATGQGEKEPEAAHGAGKTRDLPLVGAAAAAVIGAHFRTRERQGQYDDDATLVPTEIVEGDEPLRPDEVWLPVYREVEFAAGNGSQCGIEFTDHRERFTLPRLARAGVQPQNAALAVVRGDSNDPVICDGATIAIDRGTRHIIDGKFYALDHGGMLRVKKLYRLPRDCMRVVSENDTEYPEERYHMASDEAPKILGRVFWWENFD